MTVTFTIGGLQSVEVCEHPRLEVGAPVKPTATRPEPITLGKHITHLNTDGTIAVAPAMLEVCFNTKIGRPQDRN